MSNLKYINIYPQYFPRSLEIYGIVRDAVGTAAILTQGDLLHTHTTHDTSSRRTVLDFPTHFRGAPRAERAQRNGDAVRRTYPVGISVVVAGWPD